MAHTEVALQKGDLISFRVLQVTPQYVLKIVEWSQQWALGSSDYGKFGDLNGFPYKSLVDLLRSWMPWDGGRIQEDCPKHLLNLCRFFQGMTLDPAEKNGAEVLKKALQNSGLFLEGKLGSALRKAKGPVQIQHLPRGDLKGALLASSANLQDGDALGLEGIRKCLEGLEQLQILNASAVEDKGKCLFVVPLRCNGQWNFAQLLVDLSDDKDDGKQGGNKTYSIRLLLDMSSLGRVHVEASIHEKALKIDFLVGEKEVRERLEGGKAYLARALETSGFTVQSITCRCADKETPVPPSLVDELLDREKHHISLVV